MPRTDMPWALTRSCAVILWAALLSCYDAWLCVERSAGFASTRSLALFISFSVGAVLAVTWPLTLAQGLLRQRSLLSVRARLLVGALEGGFLAYLLCVRARYATITVQQKVIVAAGLIGFASLGLALAKDRPRLAKLANMGLLSGALVLQAYLPFRMNELVHLALDLMAGAGFVALLVPYLGVFSTRAKLLCGALAMVWVLLAPLTLRGSMPVRGLLYDMSTHARVHASVTGPFLAPTRVEPSLGAVRACPKQSPRCVDFAPAEASSFTKAALGADVLMLTLDAVRADQLEAFPLLLEELGAHVTFRRAFSPSSRTAQSFAAMLRGRPLRNVQRGKRKRRAVGLTQTLGQTLREQGYRAVTVATHVMLRGSVEVASGFEYLPPANQERLRGSGSRVAFAAAAAPILTVARETQSPMLAWIHALETHAPYAWDGGVGPLTSAGQLHAARDLDAKLAQFIRDFRAQRPGRNVVIAVFSDHGEEFGEHGGSFHSSTVYAEQVHVLFVLSAPRLPAQDVRAPVSTAAVPATLLSLLGLKTPCSFSVPSLLTCIETEAACPRLAVSELARFPANPRNLVAYTSARHRLVYDRTHHVMRLFDSVQDPYERHDLAQSRPDLLQQMKREAERWDRDQCLEAPTAQVAAPPEAKPLRVVRISNK